MIINKGVYTNDLGRVYKINKKEAIVEVIPRINFEELNKALAKVEESMGCVPNEVELNRRKNVVFDEFFRPKPTQLKGIPIGKKKTLTMVDLEPYKHL